MLVSTAHAYDVVAQQQAPAHEVEKPNVVEQSALTASGVTAAVENAVKNSMASVSAKIENVFKKKDSETGKSIDAFGKNVDSKFGNLSSAVQKVGADVKNLDNKLTGKGGAFEKNAANVNDVKAAVKTVDSTLLKVAAWLTFVILASGLGFYFLTKKEVRIVGTKVDELPIVLNELEAPITLENICGNDVVYKAPLIDGKRRTLALQRVVKDDYATLAEIPRGYATTVGRMNSSIIDILTRVNAGEFDGDDARSVLQRKLLALAITSGQLTLTPTAIP